MRPIRLWHPLPVAVPFLHACLSHPRTRRAKPQQAFLGRSVSHLGVSRLWSLHLPLGPDNRDDKKLVPPFLPTRAEYTWDNKHEHSPPPRGVYELSHS